MPASEWVFLQTNMNETSLVRTVPVSSYIMCRETAYLKQEKFIHSTVFLYKGEKSFKRKGFFMVKCENVGPKRESVSSFMTFDPFEKICKTIQETKKGRTIAMSKRCRINIDN
jgi:hypothetical protein